MRRAAHMAGERLQNPDRGVWQAVRDQDLREGEPDIRAFGPWRHEALVTPERRQLVDRRGWRRAGIDAAHEIGGEPRGGTATGSALGAERDLLDGAQRERHATLPLVDRRGQPGDADLGGMPAPVVCQPLQRRQGPGFVQHAILEFRSQQRQGGPETALARQSHSLSPAGPGAREVAARRGQPTAEEQQAGPGVVCRRRLLDQVEEPRGRLGRPAHRYRPRPAAMQARRAAPEDRRPGAARSRRAPKSAAAAAHRPHAGRPATARCRRPCRTRPAAPEPLARRRDWQSTRAAASSHLPVGVGVA